MIFISHNHEDKNFVEPIARRLAEVFEQDDIFFDSWSIRPGDSIIGEINEALANAKFFFSFVTHKSLKSDMVKMEWQPALIRQIKGNCQFIAIRLQDVRMSSILEERLYVDAFSIGFEATVRQLIDVVINDRTEQKTAIKISNLYWTIEQSGSSDILVFVRATHFIEPITNFLIMTPNDRSMASITPVPDRLHSCSYKERPLPGCADDGLYIRLLGDTITPDSPIALRVHWPRGTVPQINRILHHYKVDPLGKDNYFKILPQK